jgi:uncharacterized transporter YbjL
MDDEFFLDDNELNSESELTEAEKAMLKLLETINKKVEEAKDNLNLSEPSEYRQNILIISRYVGAITDIIAMIDGNAITEEGEKLTEEQILEKIEEIELTAKELSFNDLKEYEKKQKEFNLEEDEEDQDDDPGF